MKKCHEICVSKLRVSLPQFYRNNRTAHLYKPKFTGVSLQHSAGIVNLALFLVRGFSINGKLGQQSTGLPPISAVRLEQMSKAVRWLVIELQHGSGSAGGAAAHAHTSAPFDARFPEDAAQ
ncbi:hypothetical protein V6N12_044429 [Hibiscus sabdariffa]